MLSLAVDETPELRDGNRNTDVLQSANQFRYGTHVAFGHQHANAPHDAASGRGLLSRHAPILAMLLSHHRSLHSMQSICRSLLKRVIVFGILHVIESEERFLSRPFNQEFDVRHLRVITDRTGKRQAIAMSLRVLSCVLGTSPAGCPVSASFGYEHNDWNGNATGSIPDGDG